jgi:chromate transport protein ChrA
MATAKERGPLREVVLYFLRLGLLGFGGPVALVGQMERELVSDRKWLSKEQMREEIAICVACLAGLFRWKVSNPALIAATAIVGPIALPTLEPTWVMVK